MAEIEMAIDSVRVSLLNRKRVVILKEKDGDRYLPVWIEPSEADYIATRLKNARLPPLTYDFALSAIKALGGIVTNVCISDLVNDTLYALIRVRRDAETIEVYCRPSDAIAIAVRARAHILASEEKLSKAFIKLDANGKLGADLIGPPTSEGEFGSENTGV